jgi:hypothetical protein
VGQGGIVPPVQEIIVITAVGMAVIAREEAAVLVPIENMSSVVLALIALAEERGTQRQQEAIAHVNQWSKDAASAPIGLHVQL